MKYLILRAANGGYRVSPELGNVCFACSSMGWIFSLKSFAKKYVEMSSENFDYEEFAKRLWGDVYFDSDSRKFKKTPPNDSTNRTFVHFIMEPLYKIYAQAVGEDTEALKETLASLGIFLKPAILAMDIKPLIRIILESFFGDAVGLADMLVCKVPSPVENAPDKVNFSVSIIFRLSVFIPAC